MERLIARYSFTLRFYENKDYFEMIWWGEQGEINDK